MPQHKVPPCAAAHAWCIRAAAAAPLCASQDTFNKAIFGAESQAAKCSILQVYSKCLGKLPADEAAEHEPRLVEFQHAAKCEGYDDAAPKVGATESGDLKFTVDHEREAVFYRHRRQEVNVFTMNSEMQQLKRDQEGFETESRTAQEAFRAATAALVANSTAEMQAQITSFASTLSAQQQEFRENVTSLFATTTESLEEQMNTLRVSLLKNVSDARSYIETYDFSDKDRVKAGDKCEAGDYGKTTFTIQKGVQAGIYEPLSTHDNLKGRREAINWRSHGGGYAKHAREFWFPHWAGYNCYRYNPTSWKYLGSFNMGRDHVMGITQDWEGFYYIARWQYATICKQGPYPSNSGRWCHGIGHYASGVAVNDDRGEVYANRHQDDNQLYVISMATGNRLRTLNYQSYKSALCQLLLRASRFLPPLCAFGLRMRAPLAMQRPLPVLEPQSELRLAPPSRLAGRLVAAGDSHKSLHRQMTPRTRARCLSRARGRACTPLSPPDNYPNYGTLHAFGDSTQTTLFRHGGQGQDKFIDMYTVGGGASVAKFHWRVTTVGDAAKKKGAKYWTNHGNDCGMFDGRVLYICDGNSLRMFQVSDIDRYYPSDSKLLVCDGNTYLNLMAGSESGSRGPVIKFLDTE